MKEHNEELVVVEESEVREDSNDKKLGLFAKATNFAKEKVFTKENGKKLLIFGSGVVVGGLYVVAKSIGGASDEPLENEDDFYEELEELKQLEAEEIKEEQ